MRVACRFSDDGASKSSVPLRVTLEPVDITYQLYGAAIQVS